MSEPISTGAEWTFELIEKYLAEIENIAGDFGLDTYPNQIEVITSEQMLDAYSSIGMPLMYRHWSFGKHFVREEQMYRKGYTGLAYEIVINSNPCISYNMEENTMALQALVMAPTRELAARLGCSEEAARQRVARGLARLRSASR